MKKLVCLLVLVFSLVSQAWAGVLWDGTDDEINCGAGATLDNLWAAGGTIYILLKIDTYDSTARRIVSKRSTDGTARGWDLFNYLDGETKEITFSAIGVAPGQGTWTIANGITDTIFHVIIITYNSSATSNDPNIYIDGVLQNESEDISPSSNYIDDDTVNFNIGNFDNLNRPFDGEIFEVAVWKAVLTAQEIANLSSSKVKRLPLQIQPSNLKAYWSLDDQPDGTSGDGDTFKDLSGNANHGTGDDGANNTGLTAVAETVLTYP